MLRKRIINTTWVVLAALLLSSCYEEKHFDMPGEIEVEESTDIDSMPFPFDKTHQAGEYLIKDGVVDFERVSFMGYTDVVRTISGDTLSWYQGDGFYGNIQHKVFYPSDDNLQFDGRAWSKEANHAYFKPFLETGIGKSWYFYAKMSLEYLNNTQVQFWFGGAEGNAKPNVAGIDFYTTSRFYGEVNGSELLNFDSWPTGPELLIPGEIFEVEIVCVDCFVYYKVNGKLLWFYTLPSTEFSMPMSLHPWGNSVRLYDVYLEGDYEELNTVAWRQESEYTTVQSPALTKNDKEVWLFAEGRMNNCVQIPNEKVKRSHATDIVMKRSVDNGTTWSDLSLVVGDKQAVNIRPEVVTGSNGTTHLFYTVDHSGFLSNTGDYDIYRRSSTDGSTWSASQMIGVDLQTDYQVKTVSGHGLETEDGRLLVPVSCKKDGKLNMAVLYSDDSGSTWNSGDVIPGEDVGAANGNIAELADGRIMMIIGRPDGSTGTDRRVTYSGDGGMTWSEPESLSISFPNANGVRFQGATVVKADGQWVHFSPTDRMKYDATGDYRLVGSAVNQPYFGYDLKATTSNDSGAEWTELTSLFNLKAFTGHNKLTGYIDAILLDDNSILCVTEGGAIVPYEGLISYIYN